MKGKIFTGISAALMIFALFCGAAGAAGSPDGSDIVVKIDDEIITNADIEKLIDNLDPQMTVMYRTPEGRAAITEEIINARLFTIKGLEEGIDKTPEYLEEVERFKKHALMKVTIDKMLEKIEITDDEGKAFYDGNPDQFVQPEQVSARHILVPDDDEMERVLADLKAGETFEDTAKKYSTCPSKEMGGDLGYFEKGQMVPEFEKVAFETEVGKISDPVKTQFGVHVIKIDAKQPESKINYEEVSDRIKGYLMNQKRSEVYQAELKALKEKHKIERMAPEE